ncbi:hypothetical protein PoB_005793500 [Plakobranchus ocellatus]|uniref:Uncharacterized protein n=1 Tax=Plakobranchus ocellatus TaxID=259542 RepID=A0AAV4CI11_9GAST|nr:hypothetical protein PoB_005793500 [Plakobranchus ocellatus]
MERTASAGSACEQTDLAFADPASGGHYFGIGADKQQLGTTAVLFTVWFTAQETDIFIIYRCSVFVRIPSSAKKLIRPICPRDLAKAQRLVYIMLSGFKVDAVQSVTQPSGLNLDEGRRGDLLERNEIFPEINLTSTDQSVDVRTRVRTAPHTPEKTRLETSLLDSTNQNLMSEAGGGAASGSQRLEGGRDLWLIQWLCVREYNFQIRSVDPKGTIDQCLLTPATVAANLVPNVVLCIPLYYTGEAERKIWTTGEPRISIQFAQACALTPVPLF